MFEDDLQDPALIRQSYPKSVRICNSQEDSTQQPDTRIPSQLLCPFNPTAQSMRTTTILLRYTWDSTT